MKKTTNSSIAESWKDIEEWYKKHAPVQFELLQRGTTKTQLTKFEQLLQRTLPDDYKESLLIHNGQPYIGSYQYLSLKIVKKRWQSLTHLLEQGAFETKEAHASKYAKELQWWERHWVPFAEDGGGNLICLSLLEEDFGRIIEWEIEEGPFPTEIISFRLWLKKYRDDLYQGVYTVDEEGFLEGP